nr:hypothetical protein [Cytophaga aurantiaca]
MGKVESVSLFDTSAKKCDSCGEIIVSKNCCQNSTVYFSIGDDQVSSQTTICIPDFSACSEITPLYSIHVVGHADVNIHDGQFYVFETGPPKTPLYIQIRSLII